VKKINYVYSKQQHELSRRNQWQALPVCDPIWVIMHIGEEKRVERLNTFFFYEVGQAVNELEQKLRISPEEEIPFNELLLPCFYLSRQLDALLNAEELGLQVIRGPIQKLKTLVDQISSEASKAIQAVREGQEARRLDFSARYSINDAIREFRVVLSAELGTTDAYVISKKGIYSTNDLIERADNALSPSLRTFVPSQALLDFREAGKCLAFDLFTAAGFHILRATDSTLRAYYTRFVGTVPKPKARNWGTYTTNLRKCAVDPNRQPPKPDVKTISLIDQIRDMHRNPIIHPEDNLDEDKALILFDVCKSAIVAMASEIKVAGISAVPMTNVVAKP
jgi:hypothetical protein